MQDIQHDLSDRAQPETSIQLELELEIIPLASSMETKLSPTSLWILKIGTS